MEPAVLATIIAALVLVISVAGTIIPVLPGSLLTIGTLLVWAIIMGSPITWVAAVVGIIVAGAGWSSSLILTGRTMKTRQIPKGPIMVGVVGALIGMFVIPFLGIFIGFAVGLLVAEIVRLKDFPQAWSSSLAAMKAMGLGMILEFGGCAVATSSFALGSLIYFLQ